MNALQVLCHDGMEALNGEIVRVYDQGCEVRAFGRTSGPAFPKGARIVLNLLEEKSGREMNATVKLLGAVRRDGAWIYKLRWAHMPELIEENPAG